MSPKDTRQLFDALLELRDDATLSSQDYSAAETLIRSLAVRLVQLEPAGK